MTWPRVRGYLLESAALASGAGLPSRSGIELECSPIERAAEDGIGVEKLEFGVAERGRRIFSISQFGVKSVHQLRSGGVVYFPKGGDYVVCAGAKEGPGESYEPFARIGTSTGAVTSGDGDERGMQWLLHDVASVKLGCASVVRKDDSGIERTDAAGGGVRDEVDVRVLSGVGLFIGLRRRLVSGEDGARSRRKVLFDTGQLGLCLWKRREIASRVNGISDEQQVACGRGA